MSKISAKCKTLPTKPGIYIMKDAEGGIIYVGKAKNLRRRVSSYFQKKHEHPRTQKMVANIDDFEIIIVNSEKEALLLERTMIKHQKPKYNVLLKDDKEYPLLKIDRTKAWPRIEKVRHRKKDNADYLGPYTNTADLNLLLDSVYRIFPLIRCSDYEFETCKRPCNYYHMKRCLAPCHMEVDKDHYLKIIEDALAFLQGKNQEVIKSIKKKMKDSAALLKYEHAALFRDQLKALNNMKNDDFVDLRNCKNSDYIGVSLGYNQISFHVIHVRDQGVIYRSQFTSECLLQNQEDGLFEFMLQYYENKDIPPAIYVPFLPKDSQNLQDILFESTSILQVPKRGTHKRVLEMAKKNADFSLKEINSESNLTKQTLTQLKDILGLKSIPRKIECYDISHIQGSATVASLVTFVNARPKKDLYRLYNLHDEAEKPDDFRSIYEVISRRLKKAKTQVDLPDLFLIDGGKGQLNAALDAAKNFPQFQVEMVSIAKSRRLENKGTNSDLGIYSDERIFVPERDLPVPLELGSSIYRLLTQLRDEAHRFAISHHRKRRKKVRHTSQLDEIKGVGPAIRKRLFDQFESFEEIAKASLSDLESIQGISGSLAERIKLKLKPK